MPAIPLPITTSFSVIVRFLHAEKSTATFPYLNRKSNRHASKATINNLLILQILTLKFAIIVTLQLRQHGAEIIFLHHHCTNG